MDLKSLLYECASFMCDRYCRFSISADITQDELDSICSQCPLFLFMELYSQAFEE